jgi:glycosyltransferase involved in cell wall biosynthesis
MNQLENIPEISIIIPAYNESLNLPGLIPVIATELTQINKTFEILIIDDGSTDNTIEVSRTIIDQIPHVKLINLLNNYGKATALNIGFKLSCGDIVITMDADFQDDPAEISQLVNEINNGFDVVTGWKEFRQDPLEKRIASFFFNTITSLLTGLKLHDYNCGLKAYKRLALKNLNLYGDLHRFIPILLFKQGFKIKEVAVKHHPRKYGKSKYGIERYLRGFFDLLTVLFLTNFRMRPLHLFGSFGLVAILIGFCIDLYLMVLWFLGHGPIGDRPLLTLGTTLITVGIQFFISGLLAEMILSLHAKSDDMLTRIRQIISNEKIPPKKE